MKLFTKLTLIAATMGLFSACTSDKTIVETLVIDNSLTNAEKNAGIFTADVMWKMGRIGESIISPDGQRVIYTLTQYNVGENKSVSSLYSVSPEGGEPIQITDNVGKESSPSFSADGNTLYFISNRSGDSQLWAITDNAPMRQISTVDGGIDGYGVSPKGDKIWYAKAIKSEKITAEDIYPDITKSSAKIYDDLMVRHWDRWNDGTYSHIFIADFDGEKLGETKDILEGEPWDAPLAPYYDMAEIAWSNNGNTLAYTCKKLSGMDYALSTDSDIFLYDVATGSTSNITEGMVGYDKYPVFSADDSKIAFLSMERAGNESDKSRLMVYDVTSKNISYITEKFDYNVENVVWDGNNELYFIAPIEATCQICKADIDGNVAVVTDGWHDYTNFAKNGDKIVAGKTTISMATELFAVNPATGEDTQISFINREVYDNIKMGEVRQRMVKTTDGKEMLTWVILPPDFDSTKSYPTLLYCQGGPQSVVSQRWSYRWNYQLMAAQGYVVVAPNRRGLPSFGQEWLDQISGDYSGQNINDYLSAIDDVKKESWADENRMGCIGASYGGYSVFYLAGNHEKRFKAFISHCGMFNFDSFYMSTEELWFPTNDLGGSPLSDNPTAKRSYANSPHKFVKKWDTPMLIFSGLNDFRIPYTESLQAFTSAKLMGVPARLVTFSDEAHQVFKPQNSIVWNREFFGWLDKYVKSPTTDSK